MSDVQPVRIADDTADQDKQQPTEQQQDKARRGDTAALYEYVMERGRKVLGWRQ